MEEYYKEIEVAMVSVTPQNTPLFLNIIRVYYKYI